MEFDELETFIEEENARLKKSGKVLCATISNSYDYMVVMVKRSMNLAKTVVAAAASFRVAEAKEDCEFPTLTDYMDLFYFYSIIVLCAFTVLILIGLCILRSKINNLRAGQAPPGWGQQQK